MADIHDKSVSRGQRLSRRAWEKRGKEILQVPQLAFVPLGSGSFSMQNQTSICRLRPTNGLDRRLRLCPLPVSKQFDGASGAYAPSPSRQLTRPGRQSAKEILLIFSA